MKSTSINFSIAALFILLLSACIKKEQIVDPPEPENEFITTVKIRFQNVINPSDTLWAVWRDLTPDDANPADTSKAVISLKISSAYNAGVYLYDETKSPVVDLTEEVRERSNFHSYWFFKSGAIANHLTITPTDRDNNNLVLGLKSDFKTDSVVSSGRLEAVLRHQPNGKDGTFAPGTTDSDVFFTIRSVQ
jgi:hypothetical protein